MKITDEIVLVQKIVWYKATTIGHLLSVTDKESRALFKYSADAAKSYQADFPFGLAATGVYCDNMDSGELYVYVR